MDNRTPESQTPIKPTRSSWLKILGIVVFASIISTLVAVLVIKTYLFPDKFRPVTLSAGEEQVLETKLEQLDPMRRSPARHNNRSSEIKDGKLEPERYTEKGASREITLTEKELNALLAKNTNLASRLAIDLSEDLASAKLLIPLDEKFPLLGGQTLKVTAGLELAYSNGRPVVVLRGISVWGVPLPNAWLGNLKNVDLVREFGGEKGFWKAFADGVDEIKVDEHRLRIKLKE
jgi:hypothetical protein